MHRSGVRRWRLATAATSAGIASVVGLLGTPLPVQAAPGAPASAPQPARLMGEAEALSKARASGTPVPVTASTSPTQTLTANPNGSLTLTETAVPVRKLVDGAWKDLDATLVAGPGGQIAPAVAAGGLTLSGGGTGPLATMAGGGRSVALTLPFALPAPTLSGPTATYPQVLPGVDLRVTANTQGGFAEVLVVKDATAAADPRLSALTFATRTQGVTLTSDAAGNIVGTDASHRVVATAPAPTMWDSAVPAAPVSTVTDPRSGVQVEARTGLAVRSSAATPGVSAHVAPLGVAVARDKITLTPSKALLSHPKLAWPVYIDPSWSFGAAQNGFAVVQKSNPTRNYWKNSPSDQNDLQSGLNPDVGGDDVRRTLVNFAIDTSKINSTAVISSATLNITETWSYNCTASTVNLYGANGKMLSSSNATWNGWSGASYTLNDQVSVAKGHDSGCKAGGVGFDIATSIKAAAKANTKYQTFLIRAASETSENGWKRWDAATPKITIEYDHAPSQPTGLHTSPTTTCTGQTIGATAIKLYATVSDPDGGVVNENFTVWKDGNTSVKKTGTITNVPSGTRNSPFTADLAWLTQSSGGAPTKFNWTVSATQFGLTGATSATCNFTFDPTRPGTAPDVAPPATAVIGTPASVLITYTKAGDTDSVPATYRYQLNGGAVGVATADAAGTATVTVTPTRAWNQLQVTAVSAGGNYSTSTAYAPFTAAPATPRADGDFTGDGKADLLAVGGVNTLPAGLWVAAGTGTTGVNPLSTNVGANGNGTGANGSASNSPAGFNGATAITGQFTGSGLQDILYFYPADGSGGVLAGSGDGSPINPNQDDAQHTISGHQLCDLNPDTLDCYDATQVANAGNSAARNTGFVDLIGVTGSSTVGYRLSYWPNQGGPTLYSGAMDLPNTAPDGTTAWNNWTVVTDQRATGSTDMFLWNRATGALYLWSDLAFTSDGNGNNTLTYTSSTIADGTANTFNKGAAVTLRAADIDKNGSSDLWTVDASGVATAWLAGGFTAQTGQKLVTPSHSWQLNDGAADGSGTVGTVRDDVGTLTATATGDAFWTTGDLFDPDLTLAGGSLATAGAAVNTVADFSLDVWVKPSTLGGTVLSQDGGAVPGFKLWSDATSASWRFAMPSRNDAANPGWNIATGPNNGASVNAWAHLTATYTQSTGVLDLHVNGTDVARAVQPSPWSATGPFRIGGDNLSAQVAAAMTFAKVTVPDTPDKAIWDFSGDNRTDIAALNTDGNLYMYRGNGAGGWITGSREQIGTGWDMYSIIFSPGDFNSDGKKDVIGVKPTGEMFLYRGNGAGGWVDGHGVALGTGWNMYGKLFSPGDFDGDGKSDVLGVKPSGEVFLYRGNGATGWINGNGTSITSGWNIYNLVFSPGDFTGDGKTDVIARKTSTGELFLYKGNGAGGFQSTTPTLIGTGWNSWVSVFGSGDYNGDGFADVMTTNTAGDLRLYRGNGAGGWVDPSTNILIGSGSPGFAAFTNYF